MTDSYNWSSFYNALGKLGPRLLIGTDEETRVLIEELASTTDMFWSDGLQELLAAGANRIEFGTPHGLKPDNGIQMLGQQVIPALRSVWAR